MNKPKIIISWSFATIGLIIVFAFSASQRNQQSCNAEDITIHIEDIKGEYFITPTEIKELIKQEYFFDDSISLREINIRLLEESIENHPSIRKAEVYSNLDGGLWVELFQKQPLARVQNSKADYYIDELGDSMMLSSNYYAEVPLVNGEIDEAKRRMIHGFLSYTNKDEFYKDFFDGIQILENDEWVLFPKPGRHKINLGLPTEIEKKLRKLKKFYLYQATDAESMNSIKLLNLNYEGQVICRKY